MIRLENYTDIIGDDNIYRIHKKASTLYGMKVENINSTFYGGGVAEMLNSLVPLMNDVGLEAGWRILRGTPDFFNITKSFHNGLQGEKIELTEITKDLYLNTNENFSVYSHVNHDCMVIHDPQPLPLINYYRRKQPWIWRCHIDLSNPDAGLWDFLKKFVIKYDKVIVSNDIYKKLPIDYKIMYPAIDPLSQKNQDVSKDLQDKILQEFDIPTDKPLLTQISRFDKWKDPEGVLKVFKLVKAELDCRLILCGSMATDDPEGITIYETIKEKAKDLIQNRDVILITAENNLLVNVLQRKSDVIIQKSLKEGFGLTVSEAIWKETPVVASNVGGIPLQIKNGETGFLREANDIEGFAKCIINILKEPDTAKEIAIKGKEFIRKNFLITRLLSDYLDLFNELLN